MKIQNSSSTSELLLCNSLLINSVAPTNLFNGTLLGRTTNRSPFLSWPLWILGCDGNLDNSIFSMSSLPISLCILLVSISSRDSPGKATELAAAWGGLLPADATVLIGLDFVCRNESFNIKTLIMNVLHSKQQLKSEAKKKIKSNLEKKKTLNSHIQGFSVKLQMLH